MNEKNFNYFINDDSELYQNEFLELLSKQNKEGIGYNLSNVIFTTYLVILMSAILFILYRITNLYFEEKTETKKLYIVRGVPGIGKKYFAYAMESELNSASNFYAIINFKDYFYNKGGFKFEGKNLGKAESMVMNNLIKCIKYKIQRIYITGYFEKTWMYSHYKSIAEMCGYEVRVLELECQDENLLKFFNERCAFNTPYSKSKACFLNWEKDYEGLIQEPYVPEFEGDSVPSAKVITTEKLNHQIDDYFNKEKDIIKSDENEDSSDDESLRYHSEIDGNDADSESDNSSITSQYECIDQEYNDFYIEFLSQKNKKSIEINNYLHHFDDYEE